MSIRYRNVVLIGKTGAGKSTVANKITGDDTFRVTGTLDGVTASIAHCHVRFEHGGYDYDVKVVDTIGMFDHKAQEKDTIAEIKKYFRHIFPDGINVIIFVFSKGRFTPEEMECFETMISIFHEDISPMAALVVTRCEGMKAESRRKYVEEFMSNESSQKIAAFMGKGILTVGFPDLREMEDDEREIVERKMKIDVASLRDLVCASGAQRLVKQLFKD